ncbi:MAG: SelL-related redox protein [Planctomycetota bacterium]
MPKRPTEFDRPWMNAVLRIAAVYNLLWGAWVVLFPLSLFRLVGVDTAGFDEPENLTVPIWQCVGMIVGVYGIGYWVAAGSPTSHWPIVLVGLLGKLFGPIGFVDSALVRQVFPVEMGWTILTNDLIWWIPFALMLLAAYKRSVRDRSRFEEAPDQPASIAQALETETASGRTLAELSAERPALVVFLRHSGCTFCKEAAADLSRERARIERDASIVLVHMTPDSGAAAAYFERYGLGGVEHVSDPDRALYRAFELGRGSLGQLFGLRVWLRGFFATVRGRHMVGKLVGDGFQMPGVFVVHAGRVTRAFRHQDAADRPDYAAMACPAVPST